MFYRYTRLYLLSQKLLKVERRAFSVRPDINSLPQIFPLLKNLSRQRLRSL